MTGRYIHYATPTGTLWACHDCGALVADQTKHDRHHRDLMRRSDFGLPLTGVVRHLHRKKGQAQ